MDIEIDVSEGIATITLNRPEVRNALSAELVARLGDAVVGLDKDAAVAAMILTGADPAFCAGFDLRRLSTELRSLQQERQSERALHLGLLPGHETPIIGAVNGAAVTGDSSSPLRATSSSPRTGPGSPTPTRGSAPCRAGDSRSGSPSSSASTGPGR